MDGFPILLNPYSKCFVSKLLGFSLRALWPSFVATKEFVSYLNANGILDVATTSHNRLLFLFKLTVEFSLFVSTNY